jgi:hypothetical protein
MRRQSRDLTEHAFVIDVFVSIVHTQNVLAKRTAELKAKEAKEVKRQRNKHVATVCEADDKASVALPALTDDCLICRNKLYLSESGQWGAVQLKCSGCTKGPVLHVSCMLKLQNRDLSCPQCSQPFTNERALSFLERARARNPYPSSDSSDSSDDDDDDSDTEPEVELPQPAPPAPAAVQARTRRRTTGLTA